MTYGTLYGIGVGPGDPELITLKAVRILKQVAVVFAAAASKNSYSLSVEIASPHLKDHIPVVRLDFPMTRDRRILKAAWRENAEKVIHALGQGKDAAILTLGDPLTYGTFGYVMGAIRKSVPEIDIRVVPGITSFNAASASACRVLAEGDQSYTVISGTVGPEKLKAVIQHSDSVVMLKVYRNFRAIFQTLKQLDLADRSVLISRCGLEDELIIEDLRRYGDKVPPYLSLLLIRTKDNRDQGLGGRNQGPGTVTKETDF